MPAKDIAVQTAAKVRLLQKPDGAVSQHYKLTVGNTYDRLYNDGSCIVTSSDIPGETASVWRGRFEAVA